MTTIFTVVGPWGKKVDNLTKSFSFGGMKKLWIRKQFPMTGHKVPFNGINLPPQQAELDSSTRCKIHNCLIKLQEHTTLTDEPEWTKIKQSWFFFSKWNLTTQHLSSRLGILCLGILQLTALIWHWVVHGPDRSSNLIQTKYLQELFINLIILMLWVGNNVSHWVTSVQKGHVQLATWRVSRFLCWHYTCCTWIQRRWVGLEERNNHQNHQLIRGRIVSFSGWNPLSDR